MITQTLPDVLCEEGIGIEYNKGDQIPRVTSFVKKWTPWIGELEGKDGKTILGRDHRPFDTLLERIAY